MAKEVNTGRFDATFQDLELWMGLTVESLRVTATSARILTKPFRIELDEPGDVTVTVTESAVASLIANHAPSEFRDVVVRAHDGQLTVTGVVKFGFKIGFECEARLEILEERKLVVKLLSAGMLVGPALDLVSRQVEKANPVIETDGWPADIVFESVETRDGKVIVQGKMRSFATK